MTSTPSDDAHIVAFEQDDAAEWLGAVAVYRGKESLGSYGTQAQIKSAIIEHPIYSQMLIEGLQDIINYIKTVQGFNEELEGLIGE